MKSDESAFGNLSWRRCGGQIGAGPEASRKAAGGGRSHPGKRGQQLSVAARSGTKRYLAARCNTTKVRNK